MFLLKLLILKFVKNVKVKGTYELLEDDLNKIETCWSVLM